jgi:hypothetical protein
MKKWDSKFLSRRDAEMLGSRYLGLGYSPYHELSISDQGIASRMYPHKGVGANYQFVDEHYYYPVTGDGRLYRGGRSVRRVLAIPYRLIVDDGYMASLGYEVPVPMVKDEGQLASMKVGTYPDSAPTEQEKKLWREQAEDRRRKEGIRPRQAFHSGRELIKGLEAALRAISTSRIGILTSNVEYNDLKEMMKDAEKIIDEATRLVGLCGQEIPYTAAMKKQRK